MTSDRPPAPTSRRTWPQRAFLAVGAVLAVAVLTAAAGLGWGFWKFNQIHRTNVKLAEAPPGKPENYLLVGSDSRADGDPIDPHANRVGSGRRSDTIIVLRIDPAQKAAVMLSLPRDLWVPIAGTGQEQRINAAYGKGEQTLVDTVEQDFHIPINHYVEVDFKGFQDAVNAVGGIPLWFDRAMRDSNSGLDVEHPGCVVLDGYKALGFARARHLQYMLHGVWHYDGTGDLGRISRQQLFLRKTIDVAERKGLGNPVVLKNLVEAGTRNLTIDKGISANDLFDLAERFRSFDSDQLKTLTVPATPFTTSGGAQVLQMDTAAAEPILNIFRGKSLADVTEASVRVTVLNSSGTDGKAAAVAAALHGAGLGIARWGNGTELDHPIDAHTSIHYADGDQAAAELVARHLTVDATVTDDSSLTPGEVVLFVGRDFTTVQARRKPVSATTTTTSTTAAPSAGSGSAPTTTAGPTTTVVGRVPGATPPGESC